MLLGSSVGVAVVQECMGPLCNGILLPDSSFSLNKKHPDGLESYCKQCDAYDKRKRYQLLKDVLYRTVAADGQLAPDLYCTSCGETKPATEFWGDHQRRSGRRSLCQACKVEYRRERKSEG